MMWRSCNAEPIAEILSDHLKTQSVDVPANMETCRIRIPVEMSRFI